MKMLAIGGAAVIALAVLAVAFLAGYGAGIKRNLADELHKRGVTAKTAGLYKRAAKILDRLANPTSIDGDIDILSSDTRHDVNSWLADHIKETST